MLGCDMQLKHKDKTTAIYVDNKAKLKYTYSTKGFIHQDVGGTEFTSIIYLSDNESNTCIYKRLKENIPNHLKIKEDMYLNKIKQSSPRFQKALKENNESYKKTIEFKSIKNRMILFDGSVDHGVESFGRKNEKERLKRNSQNRKGDKGEIRR